MEKTTERYPIRYYSMITVAKDFISQANGSLAEGTADWKAADKELEKLKKTFGKARLLRHSGEQSHAVYISSAGNGRRKALLAVHGNGRCPPHVPFH